MHRKNTSTSRRPCMLYFCLCTTPGQRAAALLLGGGINLNRLVHDLLIPHLHGVSAAQFDFGHADAQAVVFSDLVTDEVAAFGRIHLRRVVELPRTQHVERARGVEHGHVGCVPEGETACAASRSCARASWHAPERTPEGAEVSGRGFCRRCSAGSRAWKTPQWSLPLPSFRGLLLRRHRREYQSFPHDLHYRPHDLHLHAVVEQVLSSVVFLSASPHLGASPDRDRELRS
mmetsp:Transcript_10310/g.25334  ORF Transcript_10310/g.25334 Transcript_10310/m.25334 type:complete len:231 (+) Transcript_10310:3651-4343(+)